MNPLHMSGRFWLLFASVIVTSVLTTSCSYGSTVKCEPVSSKFEKQLRSSLDKEKVDEGGLQLKNFHVIRSKDIDGTWFVGSEVIFDFTERSSSKSYDKYLRAQVIPVWAITDFGDGTIYEANIYAAGLSSWNWNELRWQDHSEEIEAVENCVRESIYSET